MGTRVGKLRGVTAKFYKNTSACIRRQVIKFQVLYRKAGMISPTSKHHYRDQVRNT